jgi:hypothetical protein
MKYHFKYYMEMASEDVVDDLVDLALWIDSRHVYDAS